MDVQCAVRARNVCFPLMFISILKGGRERENYRLYVMY